MADSRLKSVIREIFRWYLSRFPLRDGKAYFYRLWHGGLAPENRFVTAKLDKGFRMKLDLWDEEQLKVYFYGHYHERYEADLVARLLNINEVFWDIGANIGYFSLVAATALQNTGQVVAFEPGDSAYARLTENISLNPFTNLKTYQVAAGDAEGEAVLYLSGDIADSSANLYTPGDAQTRRQVCRLVTLDNFFREQDLAPPQLIKMDVEGAELAALRGAEKIIADARPLLLLEMEEKNLLAAGASKAAIQTFLKGLGYRAAFLRKGRWHLIEDVAHATSRNIFWFNPEIAPHREKAGQVLNLS
jgi:FkbM family methyltransferase